MNAAPILLIIFNRPDVTRRVFEQIRALKPSQLFIAADGPRNNRADDLLLCEETRKITEQVDWPCTVKRLYREQNLGCGKAVSGAISWFFDAVEMGIILEDDCLPDPTFFSFCTSLLSTYQNDDRVMMISGTNYIFDEIQVPNEYYFCRYYSVWGWATWKRAWLKYDAVMQQWPNLKASNYLAYVFGPSRMTEVYEEMFDAVYAGKIDTWDLQWVYTCMINNGLCATAANNLVKNIGAIGTHTEGQISEPWTRMPVVKPLNLANINGQRPVHVDHEFERLAFESLLTRFFGKAEPTESHSPSLLQRIKGKVKRTLFQTSQNSDTTHQVVTLQGRAEKKALLSYLNEGVLLGEDSSIFRGASNKWESREIAHQLNKRGFEVDVIQWNDQLFVPSKEYDLVMDISVNLQRLAPYLKKDCVKILHNTGSYWYFANNAELKRVEGLEKRKSVIYAPKRLVSSCELHEKSLGLSDFCTLIGNQQTLSTYPEKYRSKFSTLNVTASQVTWNANFIEPQNKDFLWFNSYGMVHKGLDLLIPIFQKYANWTLHVVGPQEPDFMRIFAGDLANSQNIIFHGVLDPESENFQSVVQKCFCFVSPSCSEGMSGSSATCMLCGLYPVISRENGIDLPKEIGRYLQNDSPEELEVALIEVSKLDPKFILEQQLKIREYARNYFSRKHFSEALSAFFDKIGL